MLAETSIREYPIENLDIQIILTTLLITLHCLAVLSYEGIHVCLNHKLTPETYYRDKNTVETVFWT